MHIDILKICRLLSYNITARKSSFMKIFCTRCWSEWHIPDFLMLLRWTDETWFPRWVSRICEKCRSEDTIVNFEKAIRYNEWKPQWTLVHFESLLPLVRVLEFWARKYARDNWKKPMDRDAILNSLTRHLAALMDGDTNDPESWLPHIGHIMANAMFYSYHSKSHAIPPHSNQWDQAESK